MFENGEGYEPYPAEINSIIEQAFRKKCPTAEWEETDSGRYMIDFQTKQEQKVGSIGRGLKVKRVTPGEVLVLYGC
jgi:hypothetical protein